MRDDDDMDFEGDDSDSDFEGEESNASLRPSKGEVVTKSKLARLTGLADATIDRAIADGAPIVGKGTRRQSYQINTADFFGWFWRRKVAEATNDPDAMSFNTAKRRDKEAQARLRELQIAERERELIPVDEVVTFISDKFGVVRSRFLAVESQVTGLTEEQRCVLKAAIVDAFADVSGDKREDWNADDSGEKVSEEDWSP